MNETVKYGLVFLGGIALGVAGTVLVSRGKLDFTSLASDIMSRGMDVRDALLRKVEALKEDCEDLCAEAQQKAEQRRMNADA